MDYNFMYNDYFEIDCKDEIVKQNIFKKSFIRFLKENNAYQPFIKDFEFEKYRNISSFIFEYLNNTNKLNSFNSHIENLGYDIHYSYYKHHFLLFTSYGNVLKKWADLNMPYTFKYTSLDKIYDITKRKYHITYKLKMKLKNIFTYICKKIIK